MFHASVFFWPNFMFAETETVLCLTLLLKRNMKYNMHEKFQAFFFQFGKLTFCGGLFFKDRLNSK